MDRTSLSGVTNTSALRTCFRLGEALNTGCHAVRNNRNIVLELYARIASSWRDDKPSRKQHFVIHDLTTTSHHSSMGPASFGTKACCGTRTANLSLVHQLLV